MATRQRARGPRVVPAGRGRTERQPRIPRKSQAIDLDTTREVLEQIDLAHRLQIALPSAPLIQARLAGTIEHLAHRLPKADDGREGRSDVPSAAKEVSGPSWVARFPGRTSPQDCVQPFRSKLQDFLAALSEAKATVHISSTLRPPERAYLMHWSWKIGNNIVLPQDVPAMAGVAIEWVHRDETGQPDVPKSRSAAKQMVAAYALVTQPALHSRHTEGRAIDMNVAWSGDLLIRIKDGSTRKISDTPRTGMNRALQEVGAGYGVMKAAFGNDPPHWSDDGH